MGELHGRRLSDAQLRTENLFIENPLGLEGLTDRPPDMRFPPVILGEYHLPNNAPALRCCFCRTKTPHWKGFVVEFKPKQLHLIGSTCGPRHLHLEFGAARRNHMELVNRKNYLERADDIMRRSDGLLDAVRRILFGSELASVEQKEKELKDKAGDAFIRLRAIAISGRPLTEEVNVRDLEAERRRDERTVDDGRSGPIYRKQDVAIGQLAGRGLLMADRHRDQVRALKDALAALSAFLKGPTDSLKTSDLKATLLATERAYDDATEAVAELATAPRFFDPPHLDLLVRWASSASSDHIVREGRALHVTPRGRKPSVVEALTFTAPPPLPPLFSS